MFTVKGWLAKGLIGCRAGFRVVELQASCGIHKELDLLLGCMIEYHAAVSSDFLTMAMSELALYLN